MHCLKSMLTSDFTATRNSHINSTFLVKPVASVKNIPEILGQMGHILRARNPVCVRVCVCACLFAPRFVRCSLHTGKRIVPGRERCRSTIFNPSNPHRPCLPNQYRLVVCTYIHKYPFVQPTASPVLFVFVVRVVLFFGTVFARFHIVT